MHFRQRTGCALGPQQVSLLQAIFDQTWRAIRAEGEGLDPDRSAELRNRVAQMILSSRRSGLPLDEIKDVVVAALKRNSPISS